MAFTSSAGGALTIRGPLKVSVNSAATNAFDLPANAGRYPRLDEPSTATVGSDSSDVVAIAAANNDVTVSGPITVNATDDIAGAGVDIIAGGADSLSAVTVMLGGLATDGVHVSGNTVIAQGAINVHGTGAVTDGVDLSSNFGDLTVSNVAVHVTGAVTDAGINLSSTDGNITTTNLSAILSSTAADGIEIAATHGSLNMTGTTISAADDVTNGATLSSGSTIAVATLSITLGGASADALDADANAGDISLSGLTVNCRSARPAATAWCCCR